MLLKDFRFPGIAFFQPKSLIVSVKIQLMSWVDFFPLTFYWNSPLLWNTLRLFLPISCWVGLFFGHAVCLNYEAISSGRVLSSFFPPLEEPPSNLRLLITSPEWHLQHLLLYFSHWKHRMKDSGFIALVLLPTYWNRSYKELLIMCLFNKIVLWKGSYFKNKYEANNF